MGIKSKIKKWLSVKIKNLLEFEELPIQIQSSPTLEVGKDTFHNGNLTIRGTGKIKIGSYCAFGKDIKLITSNHDYSYPVMQYSFYKKYFGQKPKHTNTEINLFSIEIGSDVWIGDNVSILPKVKIGHGAILGTGSVVTKDVAPYTIVGGIPARFIKNRFSEESKETLLSSEWWNWEDKKITANKDFFFKKIDSNE